MTRCKYCGGPVREKDNAGWWREFCRDCSKLWADGTDLRRRFDPDGDPVPEDERGVIEA